MRGEYMYGNKKRVSNNSQTKVCIIASAEEKEREREKNALKYLIYIHILMRTMHI